MLLMKRLATVSKRPAATKGPGAVSKRPAATKRPAAAAKQHTWCNFWTRSFMAAPQLGRPLTQEERKKFNDMECDNVQKAEAAGDVEITLDGLTLKVNKSCFNPALFGVSSNYRETFEAFKVQKGQRFLDMGTGCGYHALRAAQAGASVTALDINPVAVDSCKANAERLGLSEVVTVMVSDLYDALKGSEAKYDTIWFHHPYGQHHDRANQFTKETIQNLIDPEYRFLGRFLKDSKDFLKPNGRVFTVNGAQIGNRDLFNQRVMEADAVAKIVGSWPDDDDFGFDGVYFSNEVFEITY